MTSASILNFILVAGIFLLVVALVGYRLLWAGSSFSAYFAGAGWLPKRLQRLQHWLHGVRL